MAAPPPESYGHLRAISAKQAAAEQRAEPRATEQLDTGIRGVVSMADVETEKVTWLWPGWLPHGKIVMLDGDPGLGKSTLTLDLAARITTGSPMPDGSPGDRPRGVLVLTAEDGLADTVKPRLLAAGADPAKVVSITGIPLPDENGDEDSRAVSIPLDVPYIAEVITRYDIALVIIDPLMAFLGSKVDALKDQDVRRAMYPLTKLAEDTGVVIVCLRHLTKGGGTNAVYRGGGSIGIIGAARVGILVATDPDDDQRRVVAVGKSNLAETPDSLTFRVVNDEQYAVGRLAWEGTSSHGANDLLRAGAGDERDAFTEAVELLSEVLADGPVESKLVEREAKSAGVSESTLKRAKKHLGVKSERKGGLAGEGRWVMSLPTKASKASKGFTHTAEPLSPLSGVVDPLSGQDSTEMDGALRLLQDAFPGIQVIE